MSVADIARIEELDASYVRRLLRLTLIAPAVIQVLMQKDHVGISEMLSRPWPSDWSEQVDLVKSISS